MFTRDPITGEFTRNLADRSCLNCNKIFHPRFSTVKYCSLDCSQKNLPQCQSTVKEHVCEICSTIYKPRKSRENKSRFCSYVCYWKWMEGRNVGVDNNLWKGGSTSTNLRIRSSSKYKFWVKTCLIRDDFTCVICGIKGEKLHVDHIIPFAVIMRKLRFACGVDFLYEKAMLYKELWDLNNGRTLCIPCHKLTDTYLKPNK